MNVFVDYVGHSDLYYSMYALFKKRLGWDLYSPIGTEWLNHNIYISTLPSYAEIINTNTISMHPVYPYNMKTISFNEFLNLNFDIIITTSKENETPFYELCKKYKPTCIFILHIANIHELPKLAKNVLLSTKEPMPDEINWITYHPEHLDTYNKTNIIPEKIIKNYSNYLFAFPPDINMWNDLQKLLPDFKFKMHGLGGTDSFIAQENLPENMKESMFIWHVKGGGCCGYIARQALSCGKPLLVRKDYCRHHNTLALDYLKDGINCIDLDPTVRSLEQAIGLIYEWSHPDTYMKKSQEVYETFKQDINFEKEAKQIKEWILSLKKGVE